MSMWWMSGDGGGFQEMMRSTALAYALAQARIAAGARGARLARLD